MIESLRNQFFKETGINLIGCNDLEYIDWLEQRLLNFTIYYSFYNEVIEILQEYNTNYHLPSIDTLDLIKKEEKEVLLKLKDHYEI